MSAEKLSAKLQPVNIATRSFTRRSFLKTLSVAGLAAPFVTRDLLARPPSSVLRPRQLRRRRYGLGGP